MKQIIIYYYIQLQHLYDYYEISVFVIKKCQGKGAPKINHNYFLKNEIKC